MDVIAQLSKTFGTSLEVERSELERALSESTGMEAARRIVTRAMAAAGVEEDDTLTEREVERVCSELMEEGGLIRLVAESFLGSVESRMLKKVEGALWQSEEMLGNLLETIPSIIYMKDAGGRLILVNAAFEELAGVGRDSIIGQTVQDLLPGLSESNLSIDRRVVEEQRSFTHECTLVRDEGTRYLACSKSPVLDKSGKVIGLLGILRDVTEKQRTDEELLKAVKLESVGVLAGGIAHDFNNLLTAILGSVSLAKLKLERGENVMAILQEVQQAAMRARDLTQKLLTFSRGGAPVKKPTDLDKLLRDSTGFALSGSRVKSNLEIPTGLHRVECDQGQIGQVIHNLVVNAAQAMEEGGVVTVTACNVKVEDSRQRERPFREQGSDAAARERLPIQSGDYVRFSIADHGPGIAEEIRDRILDPYFTTRDRGTGLGLTTAYNVIRRHGGHLRFESDEQTGTVFHVYLPSAGAASSSDAPVSVRHNGRFGRVLLMDDEEMILEVAGQMLRYMGFGVEPVRSGEEALESYRRARREGEPFDLVILDLTVAGGMGGEDAVRRLREIDPSVRAVVSSGYSNNPVMSDYRRFGFDGVVAKPYRIEQLQTVIDQVLQQSGKKG